MFQFFVNDAAKKGYLSIRVYTDNEFVAAIKLYKKMGMQRESYRNIQESKLINEETIIFSKSLTLKKVKMWDNKYLGLTSQSEKEK